MFIRAAGILHYCLSGGEVHVLLGRRSARSAEPGQWSSFGGKIESGESPKEAAVREIEEETGYNEEPDGLKLFYVSNNGKCRFFCYSKLVDKKFDVPALLKEEHSDYGWFPLSKLPSPMMKELGKHLSRLNDEHP